MLVVGIPGTRPKTRAFVTERTWADQTKSAFSDAGHIAERVAGCNGNHLGRTTAVAAARLGIGIVAFDAGYWRRYYFGRPWYPRWRHYRGW